jgi:two-component sensor histidine kinase
VGAAAAQERWERDPEGARKALADVRRSAREAMVEMQAMLHQLRPEALGMAGLIEALREQCEALGYRTGAEVALDLGEPVPEDRVPPGTPETLFRMAQEMLANVARHARARNARLWLGRRNEEVVIRIEDDGQGFEPAAETAGMGLRNLRERAAALRGAVEVASTPGVGTQVEVRVPLIPLAAGQPVDVTRLGLLEVAYQVVVLAGLFLAAHYSQNHHDFASWPFAILLALILITGWPLGRRLKRMEPRVQEYLRQQGRILTIPMALWAGSVGAGRNLILQGWSIEDLFLLGAVGATLFLLGASGWAAFQRASEARRFWRKGRRAWLALVLPTEAGVALSAGSFWLAPERLTLNPLEVLSLLTLGIAVIYVASRQMRLEGARP